VVDNDNEIIAKIYSSVGKSGAFVEFGAYDGLYMCNTILMREAGWSGLYIEPNKKRFSKLIKNCGHLANVIVTNEFVMSNGKYSLYNIVQRHNFPNSIDFLSIDIDGKDLVIFESLHELSLKYVSIEYNDTLPNDIFFKDDTDLGIGSSALAIQSSMHERDFELIGKSKTNLYFQNKKLGQLSPVKLHDYESTRRFSFSFRGELIYFENGKLLTFDSMEFPWGAGLLLQPYPRIIHGVRKMRFLQIIYNLIYVVLLRINHLPRLIKMTKNYIAVLREYIFSNNSIWKRNN
jgi:hypothetical protein